MLNQVLILTTVLCELGVTVRGKILAYSMPRVLSLILSMVVDTDQEVNDTKIVSVSLRIKLERLNARYT